MTHNLLQSHYYFVMTQALDNRGIIVFRLKAMPHGSEKSPEKNRNEIRHSLCMPHGSAKSWQIMKKMTHKNLNIVEKTSSSV